ncbi:MAG: hypothetical protein JW995_15360 [Melioribacteraceae bacterium]|nr:hypothetical protein [Melioribacteraceae bacterium]
MKLIVLLTFFVFYSNNPGQVFISKDALKSDFVLDSTRNNYRNYLGKKISEYSDLEFNRINEKKFRSLFREMELTYYYDDKVEKIIKSAANYLMNSTPRFQHSILELLLTFQDYSYSAKVRQLLDSTQDEQVFCASAEYLLMCNEYGMTDSTVYNILESRFPGFKGNPILNLYSERLLDAHDLPPIGDLLSHDFQKNSTIIYSFHREDRNFQGITVIKKPDGRFVRNMDSTIFYIPQLALSTSNLPGIISQGNTPEGIYSVVGLYVSETKSIGPTPNIITRIPFEVSPAVFFHDKAAQSSWTIDNYSDLLPVKWKEYLPVYESYYAGKNGRRLIVMHGSTDDLMFYSNKNFYPLTPSKGCLTAKEIWDGQTGKCIESDQVKLINAFYSTNRLKGFLIVVNLDDQKRPVELDDLLPHILSAEASLY